MTENDVAVTPPVLPFESIMASISTEPMPTTNEMQHIVNRTSAPRLCFTCQERSEGSAPTSVVVGIPSTSKAKR